MIHVIFSFDCEDIYHLECDWMISQLAKILEKYGLRGVFLLTTEKAIVMAKRSPQILDRLLKHEIGYHSTSHRIDSTVQEEVEGLIRLQSLLNTPIRIYGAPKNVWRKEITEALRNKGILFERHAGLFLFYPGYKQWFEHQYNCSRAHGGGLIVFGLHPSHLCMTDLWDIAGNVKYDNIKTRQNLELFENFIRFVLKKERVKITTYSGVNFKKTDVSIGTKFSAWIRAWLKYTQFRLIGLVSRL